MPTIFSHPAVALGLAPFFRRRGVPAWAIFAGAGCTIIPDLDVVGFAFGVSYGDLLGHRGLSHSFFFAALLSGLIVLAARRGRQSPPGWCWAYLFLCTASHGLLDALTTGGLGVAFFAPFDAERYFFAWRPIRVSPLSAGQFLSSRGLAVIRSEILWVWIPWLAVGVGGAAWNRVGVRRAAAKP
jgi:inner membrane protein